VDLLIASKRRRADDVTPPSARPLVAGALALVLALAGAGCGSSSSHSDSSASKSTESAPATAPAAAGAHSQATGGANMASIGLETGGRNQDGTLKIAYTCKGADMSPPLSWTAVPPRTKELVVVVRTIQRGQVTTNWSVAGLVPSRTELRPGHVPPGAVVGVNSFGETGYKLCPPSGKPALVAMGVYAVPYKLNLQNGFKQAALSNVVGAPEVAWGSTAAYYPR
jgi:phosphatidylethanolamine-binding protein (PEBP) family uncharacterized protein